MDEYWYAKPNEVVKACSPADLAKKGIIIHPFSLPGGLFNAIEYMKARGMKPTAIFDMICFYDKEKITKR